MDRQLDIDNDEASFDVIRLSDGSLAHMPRRTATFGALRLSDGLLAYSSGNGWQAIDLEDGLTFALFPTLTGNALVAALQISDNRLIWGMHDSASGALQLYTAEVKRSE